MVFAFFAAYLFPFELFLAAYAILGPLHYLTEISWLHDRQYFSKGRFGFLWLCALTIIACYPIIFGISQWVKEHDPVFIALASALAMAFIRNTVIRIGAIILSIIFSSSLSGTQFSYLLFQWFLPSLIHVFVFTWAFILFGSLKQRSLSGYLSVGCLTALGLGYLFMPEPSNAYAMTAYVQSSIQAFGNLHVDLSQLLGWNTSSNRPIVAMRFIAFAYTYHYLNWFSKTKVIEWHNIGKARLVLIVLLYFVFIGTYAYDYKIGLSALTLLSFGHVLLEFPLNMHCFHGIGKELLARVPTQYALLPWDRKGTASSCTPSN